MPFISPVMPVPWKNHCIPNFGSKSQCSNTGPTGRDLLLILSSETYPFESVKQQLLESCPSKADESKVCNQMWASQKKFDTPDTRTYECSELFACRRAAPAFDWAYVWSLGTTGSCRTVTDGSQETVHAAHLALGFFLLTVAAGGGFGTSNTVGTAPTFNRLAPSWRFSSYWLASKCACKQCASVTKAVTWHFCVHIPSMQFCM